MDRRAEKVKITFFGNLNLFFGLAMLPGLKFREFFAATDTTKKIPNNTFIEKFFVF